MSSIRRMTAEDILSLNLTNLDPLTENYDLTFYLTYLMQWPSLFSVVEDRKGHGQNRRTARAHEGLRTLHALARARHRPDRRARLAPAGLRVAAD
ncbi:hypothetical protein KEM55_005785 [Ascosphaera atra]|nr:hypothetical protein KEM55_005785 [Ascosphaera atra]